MKRFVYITLLVFACSSCSSTYFLSTIKTTSTDVAQNEDGDFFIKMDSLWIAYSFNGEDAPIQITVFNKSKTPLYVDWQKSALILNDEAISYAGDKIEFSADAEESAVMSRYPYGYTYSYAVNRIEGQVNLPKTTTFIPPYSMISQVPMVLNVSFKNIPKKEFQNANMATKDNQPIKVKRINYTEENTPLRFSSYLTLNFEGQETMVFEDEFYLSNLLKSGSLSPSKIPKHMAKRGDLFYVEKPANTTALRILAGTAIVAGTVAIDVLIDSNDEY